MRRMDIDLRIGQRVDPAIPDTTAREYQGVDIAAVDHGEFDIAIQWSGCNGLPHCGLID